MFSKEEQEEILKQLGYEIRPYSVSARLRESGYNAMIKNQIGYEVFLDGKMVGSIEDVFKKEVRKRLFNF